MRKKLIIITASLFGLIILLLAYVAFKLGQPINSKEDILVSIPKNASSGLIVKKLNSHNLFKPRIIFIPLVKLYSQISEETAHPGTYRFTAENKGFDIIKAIFSGKQLALIKVTFPEGISLRQFASICKKKLGIDSAEFIRTAKSDSIGKEFGINAPNFEGYFYPATYNFFWKSEAAGVIGELLKYSNKHWINKFSARAKAANKSRHEILTLASIVEAETPVVSERKRIAGVYSNRLRKGMKLEADPTVQYALGEKRKLVYSDLDFNHKYNTYLYKGLPPGPINSPSLSSIEAALEPERNEYIYFVAVGDGSGRHNFARLYSQHQRFRLEYKHNRKADKN